MAETCSSLVPHSNVPTASRTVTIPAEREPPARTSPHGIPTHTSNSSYQKLSRSLPDQTSIFSIDQRCKTNPKLAVPATHHAVIYILFRSVYTPIADIISFGKEASYSPSAKGEWSDKHEKAITSPYDYMCGLPGKNVRAQIITAFNVWLDVPSNSLGIITEVIGMLHTASLLVDDIEDNSLMRRGFPVAHNIFGIPQTINSANYIYFRALEEAQSLGGPGITRIFTDELLQLHRGQGMDLYWRDLLTCPTEAEYLEMIRNKTGGLFRLAVKLMQAESPNVVPQGCVPLADMLGLLFQVRDDYQNLVSKEYNDSKGMCEDLTEGKFSFPIIHSIRQDPTNSQLLQILRLKTTDTGVKRYAVKCMEMTGSFAYTRQRIDTLIAQARHLADEIGGRDKSEGIYRLLDKLAV